MFRLCESVAWSPERDFVLSPHGANRKNDSKARRLSAHADRRHIAHRPCGDSTAEKSLHNFDNRVAAFHCRDKTLRPCSHRAQFPEKLTMKADASTARVPGRWRETQRSDIANQRAAGGLRDNASIQPAFDWRGYGRI